MIVDAQRQPRCVDHACLCDRDRLAVVGKNLLQLLSVIPFLSAPAIGAETLQVSPVYLQSGFNYHMPYRGQTFTLPVSVTADKLTVYISPNIYRSFTFTILLTEIDSVTDLHPGRVLFESRTFTIPVSGYNDFRPYTAELGGIALAAGQKYAFILDIYQFLSGTDGFTLWQYTALTGMNDKDAYDDGEYIYFTPECTEPGSGLPCGDRGDHFAGSWTADSSEDMAFTLVYQASPVNLPALNLLLLKTN